MNNRRDDPADAIATLVAQADVSVALSIDSLRRSPWSSIYTATVLEEEWQDIRRRTMEALVKQDDAAGLGQALIALAGFRAVLMQVAAEISGLIALHAEHHISGSTRASKP